MQFPISVDQLTEGWLEDQLGFEVSGFRAEQIAEGVGIMGYLYRLHLEGAGPDSVIAKFPLQDDTGRTHVAAPLRAYQAEVGYYRNVAAFGPMATAAVYAAEVDDESGDFVLLLEDLGDLRSEDQLVGCSPADAELVLTHLAAHHAAHAKDGGPTGHAWLADFAEPVRQQVIAGIAGQATLPYLATFGASHDEHIRAHIEALGATIPSYLSVTKEPLRTLSHCDVRLDNIFFGGPDRPIVLLDWQLASIGGVAFDVAYFISQSLTIETRREHETRLVDGYLAAMSELGCPVAEEAFWIDYRRTLAFCIIYGVTVGGQMEVVNDRARDLVEGMVGRAIAAIDDHDALAVWPTG